MLFYVFSFLIILAALGVILSHNPVHSVLWLIFAFINASGLFLLLGAEFLAMLNIIVYVGAVAVLFLFVVMMLDIDYTAERLKTPKSILALGSLIALALTVNISLIVIKVSQENIRSAAHPFEDFAGLTNTESIGKVLYTDFFVPFQVAGVILLVAIIGAITLTARKSSGMKKQHVAKQLDRKDSVSLVNIKPGSAVEGIDYDA